MDVEWRLRPYMNTARKRFNLSTDSSFQSKCILYMDLPFHVRTISAVATPSLTTIAERWPRVAHLSLFYSLSLRLPAEMELSTSREMRQCVVRKLTCIARAICMSRNVSCPS